MRVLQRNRPVGYVYRGGLLQALVPAVTEAKLSRDLQSASWRAREASGIIQSESEGLGIGWWRKSDLSVNPENRKF